MKLSIKLITWVVLGLVYQPIVQAQKLLSLEEAVALAIEHNPDLHAARLEIDRSRQQTVIARSLLLPSVNASAQLSHYFQLTPFFGFGDVSATDKIPYGRFGGEDQLNSYITAVQPLFNAQAYPGLRQAGLKVEESTLALDAQKAGTVFLVKQTYLQTLVLGERIQLQHESVKRNQRVLQDARSLFIQGKGLRVDTLRAYTAVKNLEPDLMKLTFALETSKLQLKTLLGVDSLQELQLTDSLFLPDTGTVPGEEEVYTLAKHNNPEYKLLELKEQISEQQVSIASAARLPSVSAVAQYQVQAQTNNFEYGNSYYPSSSFVGIQLSVPLFTGLSNHAKVKQANIAKTQTAVRTAYAYDQLRATVHAVVSNSQESLARLQTTAAVKETAKLSYDITQYRYKRGVSSRLELADAELDLSTAQSNFLEAVYDYLTSRITVQRLIGNIE